MKLRNKKTGRIFEVGDEIYICNDILGKIKLYWKTNGEDVTAFYDDLLHFNEEWEDYAPKEPLIKDEKIRKVVRAWAELNEAEELHSFNNCQLEDNNNNIMEFADNCFTNLEVWKNYTIEELCGSEE